MKKIQWLVVVVLAVFVSGSVYAQAASVGNTATGEDRAGAEWLKNKNNMQESLKKEREAAEARKKAAASKIVDAGVKIPTDIFYDMSCDSSEKKSSNFKIEYIKYLGLGFGDKGPHILIEWEPPSGNGGGWHVYAGTFAETMALYQYLRTMEKCDSEISIMFCNIETPYNNRGFGPDSVWRTFELSGPDGYIQECTAIKK